MAEPNPANIAAQQADPLAQLRDIHLPAPIEVWPPAPGWISLAVIAVIGMLAAVIWLYRRWKRDRYRREGLARLQELKLEYQQHQDEKRYLDECAELLKRIALTRYPRREVASLTGEAWVLFLDRTASTNEFTMGAGQAFIQGPYEKTPNVSVPELHDLAQYWIKQHSEQPLERAA